MAPKKRPAPGLPTRKQILDFIQNSPVPAGKREIAREFGLKGQEKIQLKALLKDMSEEGLIDGKRTAFHKMGGLPKVTVLRIIDIDEGEAIAVPDTWQPEDASPPPRIRLIEKGRGSALKKGDRVLSRTEESNTGWRAYPMKKLAPGAEFTDPGSSFPSHLQIHSGWLFLCQESQVPAPAVCHLWSRE